MFPILLSSVLGSILQADSMYNYFCSGLCRGNIGFLVLAFKRDVNSVLVAGTYYAVDIIF